MKTATVARLVYLLIVLIVTGIMAAARDYQGLVVIPVSLFFYVIAERFTPKE